MASKTNRSLVLYLVLTFAGSSYFYYLAMHGASVGKIAVPLMWVPGLSAMLTQLIVHRTLAGLGWRFGSIRYLAIAVLVPLAYCVLIYGTAWLTGLGALDSGKLLGVLPLVPLGIVFSLIAALGEEIGWRGLLAPNLYRVGGLAGAGIATGLIWGAWHIPLLVFSDYNAGTPAWYAAICFLVSVSGMSIMLAWLRMRSGSLWPAAFYHAAHNTILQSVFDESTIDTGITHWITTEFGVGLAIACVAIGAYFWRRRGELPPPRPE